LSPLIFYKIQSQDETISSVTGKLIRQHGGYIPWYYPLAQLIHVIVELIDPGHFERSIEEDEGER
jgi:hypothetical protein